jgi:hypothetical protein
VRLTLNIVNSKTSPWAPFLKPSLVSIYVIHECCQIRRWQSWVTRLCTTWEIHNGLSPTSLEVKVRPRLWDEFECENSLMCGLPFASSLSV